MPQRERQGLDLLWTQLSACCLKCFVFVCVLVFFLKQIPFMFIKAKIQPDWGAGLFSPLLMCVRKTKFQMTNRIPTMEENEEGTQLNGAGSKMLTFHQRSIFLKSFSRRRNVASKNTRYAKVFKARG